MILCNMLFFYIFCRSAQWVLPQGEFDGDMISTSDSAVGICILNLENRFTEPEFYRVSNDYTFYIENQCSHDCKYSMIKLFRVKQRFPAIYFKLHFVQLWYFTDMLSFNRTLLFVIRSYYSKIKVHVQQWKLSNALL